MVTTQIAVRLPDEMVAYLDREVEEGLAPSRAAVVVSALEREMRRRLAEADGRRLQDVGPDDDLDELVAWSAHRTQLED